MDKIGNMDMSDDLHLVVGVPTKNGSSNTNLLTKGPQAETKAQLNEILISSMELASLL